jgi:hypothetical protein
MVCTRSYGIASTGAVSPLRDGPGVETSQVYAAGDPGPLVADSDLFCLVKPGVDVVLRGTAHARGASVRVLDTGLAVGDARKSVRCWGDRKLRVSGKHSAHFTDPERFERQSLSWVGAFGGRDVEGERLRARGRRADFLGRDIPPEGALSYPRNPYGRGFFVGGDLGRVDGTAAPNLEDPADPVRPESCWIDDMGAWIDCPVAASYGPIDHLTFPRSAFLLQPDHRPPLRPVREVQAGDLGMADLADRDLGAAPDERLYSSGASGLRGLRVPDGARATLWNLHRHHELFELHLPRQAPQFLVEPPGCSVRLARGELRNILLEPDVDRLTLTWAASIAIAAPFPNEMLVEMRHAVRWD